MGIFYNDGNGRRKIGTLQPDAATITPLEKYALEKMTEPTLNNELDNGFIQI